MFPGVCTFTLERFGFYLVTIFNRCFNTGGRPGEIRWSPTIVVYVMNRLQNLMTLCVERKSYYYWVFAVLNNIGMKIVRSEFSP